MGLVSHWLAQNVYLKAYLGHGLTMGPRRGEFCWRGTLE